MASEYNDTPMTDAGDLPPLGPGVLDLINSLPFSETNKPPARPANRPDQNTHDPAHDVRNRWLNSIYLTGNNTDFRVRDFATIRAATNRHDSYWRDAHIDWALQLLRDRHVNHQDVTIVGTALAARLFSLYVLPLDPDRTSANYQDAWGHEEALLRQRPILVIPINDGFWQDIGDTTQQIAYYNTLKTAPGKDNQPQGSTGKNKSPNKTGGKPNSPPEVGVRGNGNHWSFMVIDLRNPNNPTAQYVDGMVRATRNQSGRIQVHNIHFNGPIAGTVLCGLEKLLRMPGGSFQTSTLKFVPHMSASDQHNGIDYGRCGPHLYAFIDHLLTNKATLLDPGLETTFNDEATRVTRFNGFDFNSNETRARFADDLLQERRTQEAGQTPAVVDNLTPDVLRNLMTTDGLTSLIDGCRRLVRGQPRNAPSKGGRKSGNNGGRKDGRDDDDDDDTQDKPGDNDETKALRKRYRETMNNGNPFGCVSFEDFNNMLATNNDFDTTKTKPAFDEALSKEPIPFVSMTDDRIRQWVERSPIGTVLNHDLEFWHQRAILQKIFGGIDTIDKGDSATWRDGWFKNSSMGHDAVLEEMNRRLADMPKGDYRGQLQHYPEFYLKEKGISTSPASKDSENDPKTNPDTQTKQPAKQSQSPMPLSPTLPLRPRPDATATGEAVATKSTKTTSSKGKKSLIITLPLKPKSAEELDSATDKSSLIVKLPAKQLGSKAKSGGSAATTKTATTKSAKGKPPAAKPTAAKPAKETSKRKRSSSKSGSETGSPRPAKKTRSSPR